MILDDGTVTHSDPDGVAALCPSAVLKGSETDTESWGEDEDGGIGSGGCRTARK